MRELCGKEEEQYFRAVHIVNLGANFRINGGLYKKGSVDLKVYF